MKTTVSITVDVDVINDARKKGINISKIVNDFLRSYVGSQELERDKTVFDTEDKIQVLKAQLGDLEQHKKELMKDTVIIKG